jgi:hypothetical protein
MGTDLVRPTEHFIRRPLRLNPFSVAETRTGKPLHHRFSHIFSHIHINVSSTATEKLRIDADISLLENCLAIYCCVASAHESCYLSSPFSGEPFNSRKVKKKNPKVFSSFVKRFAHLSEPAFVPSWGYLAFCRALLGACEVILNLFSGSVFIDLLHL